jgi:poly(beta-D-mannuronate) lyase
MDIGAGVHHCRVTRNVFALQVSGRGTYLSVSGDDNEIDHNTFRNKNTEGQMLYVQGPGGAKMAQRTWIHHNHFHDFKSSGRNNSSGLHIGSSWRSMSPAHALVEHNLFVRNRGENEGAICNKSCDNIYRFNTILDSTELSLRHGHRCQVYANYFINTSGVRFFGHDHQIYSNYFEQCRPAIAIGNGGATIPPGPLTSHERPEYVKVVYNTLVNNRTNVQMGPRRNGLGCSDLVFANNMIVGGDKAVLIAGPLTNPTWEGNILWSTQPGELPMEGYAEIDPVLTKDDHGVRRLSPASPAIGRGIDSYRFVDVDIDGQPRSGKLDVGCDQFLAGSAFNRPLSEADVGPKAAEEQDRALIVAPMKKTAIDGAKRNASAGRD